MDPVNFQDDILNNRKKKKEKELKKKIEHPSVELQSKIDRIARHEYDTFNTKVEELVQLASGMALFRTDTESIRDGLIRHFSAMLYSYVVDFDPLDPEVTADDLHTHEALIRHIIEDYGLLADKPEDENKSDS